MNAETTCRQQAATTPEIVNKPLEKRSRTISIVLVCIALAILTGAVYMQVGNHQFINFDDNVYVTENAHVAGGITGQNIIWAFTSVEFYNWHPLTWLSHMADVQFYGMNPRGHHLTSVAIHTISAVLLFLFLVRTTGGLWQSAFVAALFALHPLHVESVAWVAERKDVLSAFFCFLTLIAYAEYVAARKKSLYILSLFLFVLGLMSKPMLVTLPLIMLLLDYWPLKRFSRHELDLKCVRRVITLVQEKIPFFACSLFSGLVTIYAQQKGGAVADLTITPFAVRIGNALLAYATYIGKTLWPRDLAIFYPYPSSIPLWQVFCSLFVLLLFSVAAIRARDRHPYFTLGWFWFLITLVPVIGLIQVGGQSMADRYTYIPLIGLFIMAAWGVPFLTREMRRKKNILVFLSGTVVLTCAVFSWRQLGYWQDNFSLYRHTLHVTTGNYAIHNNFGSALQARGNIEAAISEYQEALRINPNYKHGANNLQNVLLANSDRDAAILEYQNMLQTNPDNVFARKNLGFLLASKGDLDNAIHQYQEVLRVNRDDTSSRKNLGDVFARKGDHGAAILEYREVLRIAPHDTDAHNRLKAISE